MIWAVATGSSQTSYEEKRFFFLLQNIKIMDLLIEIFEIHVDIRHSIPEEEQNKK